MRFASLPIAPAVLWVFCLVGMSSPHPTNEKALIIQASELGTSEEARTLNYPCPVCGQLVDATNAEQILLHHEHVTHPRDFLSAKQVAA